MTSNFFQQNHMVYICRFKNVIRQLNAKLNKSSLSKLLNNLKSWNLIPKSLVEISMTFNKNAITLSMAPLLFTTWQKYQFYNETVKHSTRWLKAASRCTGYNLIVHCTLIINQCSLFLSPEPLLIFSSAGETCNIEIFTQLCRIERSWTSIFFTRAGVFPKVNCNGSTFFNHVFWNTKSP